jgi:hypothetical protein
MANGTFIYTHSDGTEGSFVNPPNGQCLPFDAPAISADNQTDTNATVYTSNFCSGDNDVIEARTGKTWGLFRPSSVRFG